MIYQFDGLDRLGRMAVNILLVDDDPVQAGTRKAILDRAGFAVAVTPDGREGLAFLNSQAGSSVRMLVTDHLMPTVNGVELVKGLREAGHLIPVLVLSGFPDVEEQYDSLDVTFRVKPFPPDQLIALVQYLLAAAERRTA